MDHFLQWLGGGCYLLNKVFLSLSEHARFQEHAARARRWRIAAWTVYLVGLPPWVIIFIMWRNWIAASVEASGAPAMLLGLVIALRGLATQPPRWLNRTALAFIPAGFCFSLYDFGGLTAINQWLEVGLAAGFLVGTYQLAHERASGYLWYVLMHVTCGSLMWIQGYPWLFAQQLVSLVFIADAYRMAHKLRMHEPQGGVSR